MRGRGAVEMPGLWKAWKAKSRLPTPSTSPLEISPKGSEISTFPPPQLAPDGKVENQKQVSTFPRGASDDDDSLIKIQRKEVGRCAASSFSYAALPPVERRRFHAHPSIGKCCINTSLGLPGLPRPFLIRLPAPEISVTFLGSAGGKGAAHPGGVGPGGERRGTAGYLGRRKPTGDTATTG
jgi:hypothetical protein